MAHLGQLMIWLVNFLPGLGPWVATCQNIVNWSHQCAHYRTPIKPFLLMGESSSSTQLVQVFTVLTTRVKTWNLAKLFVRIKSFLHNQSRAEVFLSRNPLSGHFISWQKNCNISYLSRLPSIIKMEKTKKFGFCHYLLQKKLRGIFTFFCC